MVYKRLVQLIGRRSGTSWTFSLFSSFRESSSLAVALAVLFFYILNKLIPQITFFCLLLTDLPEILPGLLFLFLCVFFLLFLQHLAILFLLFPGHRLVFSLLLLLLPPFSFLGKLSFFQLLLQFCDFASDLLHRLPAAFSSFSLLFLLFLLLSPNTTVSL